MLEALLAQNDRILGKEEPNFSTVVETALKSVKIGGKAWINNTKGNTISVGVRPDAKALWRVIDSNLMTEHRSDLQNTLEELTGREIEDIVFKEISRKTSASAIMIDIVFKS